MPSTLPIVKVGQIWMEIDPRRARSGHLRYVLVLALVGNTHVRIRRVKEDGSPHLVSRMRDALRFRFDDRHTGYTLHRDVDEQI